MLIPLRVHTKYSLLNSTIETSQVISYCKKNNIHSCAFANSNNLFNALNWSIELSKNKIKPIIGCALKVSDGFVWAYCKNHEGYIELSNLLSSSYIEHKGTLNIDDICLKNCLIIVDHSLSFEEIKKLKEKNQIYIAISRQEQDEKFENLLFDISNKLNIPAIAAPQFHCASENDTVFANALLCIKNNTYLKEENREYINDDMYFMSQQQYELMFQDIPFTIKNSEIFAKKCNFYLKPSKPVMPVINYNDPVKVFKDIIENQLIKYCKEKNKDLQTYRERLDFESAVILEMNFHEYFLIVADIVNWCKENSIPVGPGRGSAASSLIVFFLGITNLDPLEYNLMFERFLNPSRISLPDIDLDFCQEKRHLVIEYIQKKYGKEKVALIMTFGTLQYRIAIRDVGRILQLPHSFVDRLCKSLPPPVLGINPSLKDLINNKIIDSLINDETKELFEIAKNIEGIPRHVSTHAAGIVIGNQNLANIIPLFKEENVELSIIQGTLKDAESFGLVKFDILGLAILSVLFKTCELLKRKNIDLDLNSINLKEPGVFELLSKGYVKGVFQADSPGFRKLFIEMKPNVIEDVIAAGALYRPGPMADIPQFIKCKHNNKEIEYLYPQLENILKETYGVIVYQEQILEIAKELAGYSLKEADLLRRAMGKKIKSEMEMHEKKFISGVVERCGHEEKAKILYENLIRFASYAFCKAHAAPYGIITYTSAYCKAFYTIEFVCATLMYENTLEKVEETIKEARTLGVHFLSPCINKSSVDFDIINNSIIFGISKIKGIGEIANKIIEERNLNGKYKSLYDFNLRIKPNKRVIENLIYAGAFDCFNTNRAQLFSEVETNNTNNNSLFEEEVEEWSNLTIMLNEYNVMETIFNKYDLNLDLSKLKIQTRLNNPGLLFCIGLKNNVFRTKDGREINEYIFHDADGVQVLHSVKIDIEKKFLILHISKNNNRYYIDKAQSVEEFMKIYHKIFISGIKMPNLPAGNTSLYIDNEYKKDVQLNFNFLIKNYNNITYIA